MRIKQITSPNSISSLELISGSTTDSYTDYKIINNGDFKITSSTTSSDVDRFVMNSSGNITIAGTLDTTGYFKLIEPRFARGFLIHPPLSSSKRKCNPNHGRNVVCHWLVDNSIVVYFHQNKKRQRPRNRKMSL